MRGFARSLPLALLWIAGCSDGMLSALEPDVIRLPTGALLGPESRYLLVANSNLDGEHLTGSLVAVDLEALEDGLAEPGPPGAETTAERPCRVSLLAPAELECDERYLIDDERTLRLPSGATNIAADLPAGASGPLRLMIPSSVDRTVTWIDVLPDAAGLRVDCGQDGDGRCDEVHTLRTVGNSPQGAALPIDPARLFVDEQGFRFAYLPHLLGGSMTLIALDGGAGPEIVDVQTEFFLEDALTETGHAGGFAVAQRVCDPENPPERDEECARPALYATQRHWPGVRQFSVAIGLDVLLPEQNVTLAGANPYTVADRPYMGDLEFEDPQTGERMLVVHTTPPALSRVDTRIVDGVPLNETRDTVALCHYPNQLEVFRPEGREWLAFVSCYSEGEVAVVGLNTFTVIATARVGDGANELVVDVARERLYVVNTLSSDIAVLELDNLAPRYLEVIARVGL
ncbi:MAG: hypothetical protein H6713_07850 [Myxococcales bacterium]|nr:hypothetical protein [Myxococcales bacterium]MCB9749906.1 hypothetical protein [Myxococcales bacterium]